MKPTELRVGNWVQLYRSPEENEMYPQQIISIEFDAVGYITGEGYMLRLDDGFFINCDTGVLPIPLTEDWLLKFGFTKGEQTKTKGNGGDYQPEDVYTLSTIYSLYTDDDPDGNIKYELSTWHWRGGEPENQDAFWFYHDSLIRCEYVHQLQNLYHALTGKELIPVAL